MRAMLFGVSPTDFSTFCVVGVMMLVTALVAAYVPARRATLVDPLVAMRTQ
jgi:ABC-type lipoprotein release transport system permease subunit